ncbi:MAG: type II secretion system protein, partial [Sedimentisphaerales bacterium]
RAFTSIIKENKVKPIAKQSNEKTAFTIVELLTVMSIIIILMGLLAPAMNRARRYARKVSQKNQFHSIDVALEMFRAEFDGYPDSGAADASGAPYCGAMKLAEAMLGQDLLGFHPDSRFRADGTIDGTAATQLYPPAPPSPFPPLYIDNLKTRKEHYLPLENANAYELNNIYPNIATTPPNFNGDRFVLCDAYTRVMNLNTGKRIGMPILYYKANTSNTMHDHTLTPLSQNIYNYMDNDQLVGVGKPWDPTTPHTLSGDAQRFYDSTRNQKIKALRPYRVDSYILISAGFDGEYGTPDDVFNFGE